MKTKKHINEEQPSTVDEHFELILNDRSTIDSNFVKVTPDDLPEWFDERLFKIGQEYYVDNLMAFGVAHLAGLIAILAVPDILEVLVYTRRSNTPCLSYKRFVETLLLMYALFKSDMLDPNSKWFEAINSIRWKHAMVSKRRVKEGLNAIYQKDMAITQYGFVGYCYLCPEKVGLAHGTVEQNIGFNHFWQVTGYLMGIDNRINVCRKSVTETKELCRRIGNKILAKHLRDPEPEFLAITANTLQGLWYADITINEDAFMSHTYNMSGVKYEKPLGWFSYFSLKRLELNLYMSSLPYIGRIVRSTTNCILAATYWLLEHYPVLAWIGYGKKNTKLCLYPNI